jgi:hypothetical protein
MFDGGRFPNTLIIEEPWEEDLSKSTALYAAALLLCRAAILLSKLISCKKALEGNHPDISVIYPSIKAKA